MAKFLNKKEQVFDFQFTSYGKYLLSIGSFKPYSYAFMDDNVLYDAEYAAQRGSSFEHYSASQNSVHPRIKENTPYLEGLTLFRDVSNLPDAWTMTEDDRIYSTLDVVPTLDVPDEEFFKIDKIIGDARLSGETQKAPAWKVVTLQSRISSSIHEDKYNKIKIPQINITAKYKLSTMDANYDFDAKDLRNLLQDTQPFIDDRKIILTSEDPVIYLEEVNTELLTENFELEVFDVTMNLADPENCVGYGCARASTTRTAPAGAVGPGNEIVYTRDELSRKYFEKEVHQIVDGFMISSTKKLNPIKQLTTSSVEYYFDVLADRNVQQEIACQGMTLYNKQSYYIDLDFECEEERAGSFYDIYGATTQPEICLD